VAAQKSAHFTKLDLDAIERWVGKGAQVSPRVLSLMKDAAASAVAASEAA